MKKKGRRPLGFSGIGRKMLLIFTVILTVSGGCLSFFSVFVFRRGYSRLSQSYLNDVTQQTTNNLESMIRTIEDINIQILSSSVIQEQLRYTNTHEMDEYGVWRITKIVERELETNALYNSDVISMSIISRSGIEYTVANINGKAKEFAFSEEEIYEANGTTLWGLVGEKNDICIAKAILDLKTMMPLGYINIVYKQAYFGDIVQDNSTQFEGAAYVVDQEGVIVAANEEQYVGRTFPGEIGRIRERQDAQEDRINGGKAFYYVGDKMPNGWILVECVSVQEFNKYTYQIIGITVGFLLFLIVLGFICIRLATDYIVRPTRELVESMKQFGEGNLSRRVEVKTKDEIAQIGNEYNRMAANIETLIEQVYKMEILQKQSEIDFLCMQINPHFLYNTLDTISWMAIMENNTDVSEMTIALADLLRAMVKSERFISVEEEMKTVEDYLFIQKQRFGEKITAHCKVDENAYPCQIPNFILQPLIENAILHGLEPKLEKGTLQLCIAIKDERMEFCIEDDGVGMTEEETRSLYEACENNDAKQSIGLKNVYRRLILCYGEIGKLKIESEKNRGTRISFCIPMEYKKRSEQYDEKRTEF